MKCIKPFLKNGVTAYGCGQCRYCRIKQRRIWKCRIMLEAMQYQDNAFVTLTYSDECLPMKRLGESQMTVATLNPRDLQLFLKRLRKVYAPRLRFFAVGEYGSKTWRPHYHFGGFNFPNCLRGETKQSITGRRLWSECCDVCRLVGETWGQGDIEVRSLGTEKCEYLARYVTKKMTSGRDPRLEGRFPEFSRQSRRPGVGVPAVGAMACTLRQFELDEVLEDVPLGPSVGGKPQVMGRLMRQKLRKAIGRKEVTPEDVQAKIAWEGSQEVLQYMLAHKGTTKADAYAVIGAAYEEKLKHREQYQKDKL